MKLRKHLFSLAFCFLVSALTYAQIRPNPPGGIGGGGGDSIIAVNLLPGKIVNEAQVLEWDAFKGANSYNVSLTSAGNEIFKAKTSSNSILVDFPSLAIVNGAQIKWTITSDNGKSNNNIFLELDSRSNLLAVIEEVKALGDFQNASPLNKKIIMAEELSLEGWHNAGEKALGPPPIGNMVPEGSTNEHPASVAKRALWVNTLRDIINNAFK